MNIQLEDGSFTVTGGRNKNTAKYLYNGGTLLTMFNNSARFLSNNEEFRFSEDEIKSYLAGHTTVNFEGVKFPVANENTKTLKDYILLSLHQTGVLSSQENSQLLTDLIPLKYLEVCHPELLEHIPGLKELFIRNKEAKEKYIAQVKL